MNITLLICITTDIVLFTILILLIIEVFVFEKVLQKRGISFLINLGNIISKNQLRNIISLLESEDENYKGQGRRVTVYRYKWQFAFFYLIRLSLAHIYKHEELKKEYQKIMKRDSEGALSCGVYMDRFNIIEIYEFNLKKISQKEHIDILKVQLVNCIAHEFRHKIQYFHDIKVEDDELDAESFAVAFCNKNKQKMKEILNMASAVTFLLSKDEIDNNEQGGSR